VRVDPLSPVNGGINASTAHVSFEDGKSVTEVLAEHGAAEAAQRVKEALTQALAR